MRSLFCVLHEGLFDNNLGINSMDAVDVIKFLNNLSGGYTPHDGISVIYDHNEEFDNISDWYIQFVKLFCKKTSIKSIKPGIWYTYATDKLKATGIASDAIAFIKKNEDISKDSEDEFKKINIVQFTHYLKHVVFMNSPANANNPFFKVDKDMSKILDNIWEEKYTSMMK